MTDTTLDYDELEQLSTPTDDDTDLVRTLRGRLKAAGKRAKDRDDLASENQKLKLSGLMQAAGLGDLNEHQRETLAEWAGRQADLTAEQIHERAVALGWAEAKPDPADDEIAEHDAITAATSGAPAKGAHQITPEDARSWTPDQLREFKRQHPGAFEKLKRGETVTGIAFP